MQVEFANKLALRDKINRGSSQMFFFGILPVLNMGTSFCTELGLHTEGIVLERHGVYDPKVGDED